MMMFVLTNLELFSMAKVETEKRNDYLNCVNLLLFCCKV